MPMREGVYWLEGDLHGDRGEYGLGVEGDAESRTGALPTQKKSPLLTWVVGGFACLLILLGIVFGLAVAYFKTDVHFDDPTVGCPGGHRLAEFWTPDSSYHCNVCGDSQRRGTHMFGCRICNWDKCWQCANNP